MDQKSMIDQYISGNLSESEKAKITERIANDKEFAEEVKFRSQIGAVAVESERKVLKKRLQKMESNSEKPVKNNLRRVIMIIIGMLLIAAAFIGYNMEKKSKSPEAIYAAHYETYPNVYHPVTRGNSDELTRAFMAYENSNFSEASEMLEVQISESANNLPLIFYQGLSYGEIGNYALAIKNLEEVKNSDSEYSDEAYWYLGLFYLKQGNKNAAIARLDEYKNRIEDPSKKESANQLLDKI